MVRVRTLFALTAAVSAVVAAGIGCGSGSGGAFEEVDNGFESDDPTGRASSLDMGTADAAAAPEDMAGSRGDSADAARAVQEADIIKVEGSRLYALSRYGGLTIVDISSPDAMKLLGRKRIDGQPFEMYVENGRAFVMLNEFGRYVRDESPYGRWVQSSEILALDVRDPAAISEVSHFDVPGSIADSRLVGHVAYVVTYEDGYCWGCQTNPATIVTSFDVEGAIAKKDQLVYSGDRSSYSWRRSVSATNERLYIGGPEWSWQPGAANGSSVVQVVDISDPAGTLKRGAEVHVAGHINSRWQMDEYQGVLRVVSQFGQGWGPSGSVNPKVQTFTVASSTSITPLGQTDLVLPKPESLRSVRFDGTRGYAITAEQTDPLFTIDLADPAAPKQAGELEMPGWIFHMEPRGDRLIGFGYDSTRPNEANLAVSLFDVSDLSTPTMLKRVSFGSGWGQVAEDQDRIHKSVRVLDEQGLILVPFASYGRWNETGCEQARSGIQLIDYGRDDLALQGIAPQHGLPRRAFVANGRLVAMSDRNVTSFDIGARAKPVKTGELDLSNPAYRLVELPSHVASITSDWWTGEVLLSLTPKENADDASVTGKLSLSSLAPESPMYCAGQGGWGAWYEARLFASENTVYVTVPVYTYEHGKRAGKLIAAAIDVSNPTKPVIAGKVSSPFVERDANGYWGPSFGFWDGYAYYAYWMGSAGSLVGSGQSIVQSNKKLAYIEIDHEPIPVSGPYGTTSWEAKLHRRLHVFDFSDASAPKVAAPIALPESLGASPLHLYKDTVLTSRWVASRTPGKVRFFMDRVDIRGETPSVLPSVNTPGSLLLADEPSSRIATTDYRATVVTATSWEDCQKQLGWAGYFDPVSQRCVSVARDFKLADLDGTRVTLRNTLTPPAQNIAGVQIADDRIYVTRMKRYDYSRVSSSDVSASPRVLDDGGLWAIGGIRAGQLSIVSQMAGDADWPLAAHGTKVAVYTVGGLAVYDTQTPQASLVTEANLRGWGYSSHVLLGEDRAICSLGEWGLQTIRY